VKLRNARKGIFILSTIIESPESVTVICDSMRINGGAIADLNPDDPKVRKWALRGVLVPVDEVGAKWLGGLERAKVKGKA